MSTVTAIESFLKDFKFKLGFWGLLLQNRLSSKNFQTLTDLEFRVEDLKRALGELQVEDYSEGPIKDLLYNGADMWVFGKDIKKREVYIKITMGQPNDKVICISFHFAEYALTYPYKKCQ
jgi:hypothetical protein